MGLAASLVATQVASALTVTRGPYLQQQTSSSIIVRWRTDTTVDSSVTYGSAPGMLTSSVNDPTPTTEHIVTVTGLAPDTQYYYSVGSGLGPLVGDDVDHYFRTAPVTGPPHPIRIWSIGDAGWYTGVNATNGDVVRDAYKTFNGGTSTADLFLLLGDNAYLLATDVDYQQAVFNRHQEMLRTTPVWSVFGNHERFSSLDLTQAGPYFDMFSFPTAGEAGGVASGTEAYYSFDYANVHFIVLDSEDFVPISTSGPMLTWLQADLTATTADWVIALWHRPPYSKGLLHDSDAEVNEALMRIFVLPVLESFGVDLVLCGHSHSYERSYFLDGHYGVSTTFDAATHTKDPGDGDPAGDGPYHKAALGSVPNAGAVYVVNGSGSEVRIPLGNHPAMLAQLAELGSLVIDIDRDTLTAKFLTSTGPVDDQFRIIKGTACPAAPATGCVGSTKAKATIRTNALPNRNRWAWKTRGGTVSAPDLGTPTDQTDLAVCVYDANGAVVGGQILHGAPQWSSVTPSGLRYRDPSGARHGLQRIRVKFGAGAEGRIQVKAKGALIGTPTTPVTGPLTAQLVNLDTGKCWQSVFTTFRSNVAGRVAAAIP
ncbi:MAG: purple acid phosphatase family protein [Candidatus Binatia bacterium]